VRRAGRCDITAPVMDDAALLELPDDPVLLKQVIAQRDAALAQRDAAIAQRESQIEQIKREAAETIEAMTQRHKAEMDAILRKFYGPRSERFDPTQLLLFGLMIDTMPIDRKSVEQEAGEKLATRRVRNRHNHGRQQLPGHLPRVPVPHDLSDEQKKCPCCGKARKCIGVETSEQLECLPIQFHVLRHERYKYACVECDQAGDGANIEMAVKPPQPIEKGLAGPGLLAYVAVSKLADHLPLYRLEDIFARVGVTIARSTMCGWMDSMATLLKPLYDLMGRRVKQGEVIHTDDTRVPVQDETVKGKCKSGRIWCFLGDESNPYDIYHYTPDRTRAGPSLWLDVFKGYLQADAYSGYDGIFAGGAVIEVACWAHARRKFFEAKDTDGRRSAEMLAMVQGLYAVEDEAREAIAMLKEPTRQQREQIRHELRQQKSVPILARIKTWLDAEQKLVLPRSPMAQAIGYALNQWTALSVEQGEEQRVVASPIGRPPVNGVEHGSKFGAFEIFDHAGAGSLKGNGQQLLTNGQRFGIACCRTACECVYGGKARIPCCSAVAAFFFQMIQKRQHAVSIQAVEIEPYQRQFVAACQESQQENDCVTVALDGVRADTTNSGQVVAEKPSQCARERVGRFGSHLAPPTISHESAKRQRIGAAPGDAAFGIDPLEVADQQQPEILPRRKARPADLLLVELGAQSLDELVELPCCQHFIELGVECMRR